MRKRDVTAWRIELGRLAFRVKILVPKIRANLFTLTAEVFVCSEIIFLFT